MKLRDGYYAPVQRIGCIETLTRRGKLENMRDPLERYFVYILLCSDDTYYVGVTRNVEKRLREHQEGADGQQSYTFRRRPVQLMMKQEFREILDAIAWEKQLKGWGRKKKEALIRGDLRYASLHQSSIRAAVPP
jgi:putative endonuclease